MQIQETFVFLFLYFSFCFFGRFVVISYPFPSTVPFPCFLLESNDFLVAIRITQFVQTCHVFIRGRCRLCSLVLYV